MGAAEERQASELLECIRQLVLELHPRRGKRLRVSLETTLDRELGFDSLSRVELLLRLQRQFGVALPERLFAEAETPADLLDALRQAGATLGTTDSAATVEVLQQLDSAPVSASTLPDVLAWHVERNPERPHVYLYGDAAEPQTVTYRGLADGARSVAADLQTRGLQHGQAVSIMLPTSLEYLHVFFGVLLAGGVPVPIYPPLRPSQIEDHLRRHAKILENAGAVMLVTVANARQVGRLLQAHVPSLDAVVTPQELRGAPQEFVAPTIAPDDVAFLQYTSGSTGQPKGVVLTHANLLANITAMGEAVGAQSTDVFVSWLPLYHDMGLIGAWLASLYFGMPCVLMSPLKFLTFPPHWLRAVHRHRATLTAAPNFAYELCLSKIEPEDLRGLDLSSLRMAFNGAEPVSPNTVRRFTEGFAAYGFKPQAFAPVYGLAEAAVGLAFPPLDRGPIIDRVQRAAFESAGRAVPAEDDDSRALEFVACGQPLPGYQIRIVDGASRELPDRQEGRLEFQGPSATSGYMRNPEATTALFDGVWLDSGDLAYVAGGDVYLTRRVKDVIIRAGRNVYPYEIEEAVGDIKGVRKGCVAVFGSPDPDSGTERVIVVAETRETDSGMLEDLRAKIERVSTDVLYMPPDEVVLAPPHSVLKTSSGKIRRAAVRALFEEQQLGQRPRAVWWQIARLALTAWQPRLKALRQRAAMQAYGAYAYLALGVVAVPVWLLVLALPRLRWRIGAARGGARLLLRLTRTPVTVEVREPEALRRSAVFVANHSSYLDGLVLIASLPGTFSFIAKGELADQFFAGRFLRGIGATFVERFDVESGVADAQRIAALAESGTSIVFFPEGTFTRAPGLLPFHMGAFVAAVRAGVPVVPISIAGTRSLLRADSWLPRRGSVRVVVGNPVSAEGSDDWSAAMHLRDAARMALLGELEEPDLAGEVFSSEPVSNS